MSKFVPGGKWLGSVSSGMYTSMITVSTLLNFHKHQLVCIKYVMLDTLLTSYVLFTTIFSVGDKCSPNWTWNFWWRETTAFGVLVCVPVGRPMCIGVNNSPPLKSNQVLFVKMLMDGNSYSQLVLCLNRGSFHFHLNRSIVKSFCLLLSLNYFSAS